MIRLQFVTEQRTGLVVEAPGRQVRRAGSPSADRRIRSDSVPRTDRPRRAGPFDLTRSLTHERRRHRARPRRESASKHRGAPAGPPRLLRELAERSEAARRRHWTGATLCRAELSAAGRAGVRHNHGARRPLCRPMDRRVDAGAAPFGHPPGAALAARPAVDARRQSDRAEQLSRSRAVATIRKGTARIDVRASVFCVVREPVEHPLCTYYAAVCTRLLALFDLETDVQVVACRGTGERSCILTMAVSKPMAGNGAGATLMRIIWDRSDAADAWRGRQSRRPSLRSHPRGCS